MKTKEQLEAEILVHKASGATRKVKLLEEQLNPSIMEKPSAPNPVIAGDRNEVGDDVLYEYHSLGSTWKEIETLTGVKSAWFRVRKYAKDNDKPYPVKP